MEAGYIMLTIAVVVVPVNVETNVLTALPSQYLYWDAGRVRFVYKRYPRRFTKKNTQKSFSACTKMNSCQRLAGLFSRWPWGGGGGCCFLENILSVQLRTNFEARVLLRLIFRIVTFFTIRCFCSTLIILMMKLYQVVLRAKETCWLRNLILYSLGIFCARRHIFLRWSFLVVCSVPDGVREGVGG